MYILINYKILKIKIKKVDATIRVAVAMWGRLEIDQAVDIR